MRKSIACIAQGFVGSALSNGMSRAFNVYAYDRDPTRLAKGAFKALKTDCSGHVESVAEFVDVVEYSGHVQYAWFERVYFVCVPTPMLPSGACDTSIVASVVGELASAPGERIAVIKSTVPPGTTEALNEKHASTGLRVVHNPEFLREATAEEDFANQDRIVLGGPPEAVERVKAIYNVVFPDVQVLKSKSTVTELVKYVTNTFLATKVSYANEIFQVCEKLGVDYDRVMEIALRDERLGRSHWKVPGPMPADDGSGRHMRGFSGSCFIKDLNALIAVAQALGVDPKVMRGAWEKNLEVRPERDWENLVGRAVSLR